MDSIYSVVAVFSNVIDPSLSSVPASSVVECVNLCFHGTNCASFFYDSSLGLCYQSDMLYTIAANHGLTVAQNVNCYEWKHVLCPSPWSYSKPTGMCLLYIPTMQDYTDARQSCADVGAWLVHIYNEKQNAFVLNIAIATGMGMWLGLSKGSNWVWDQGDTLGYQAWYTDHPKAGSNCAMMSLGALSWKSKPCSDLRYTLCQLVLTLPANCNI